MIFSSPTPWREAIASRELKAVMPTDMSSAELSANIHSAILERSVFSAKTINADYLQKVNALITRIVSPEVTRNPITQNLEPTAPGQSMDPATARLEMKQALQSLGYQPDPEKRGGLQDLSSDVRINLVVKTNTEMAQGFGTWYADQDEARLDAWPAQELYRLEDRAKKRDWVGRWLDAGGQILGGRMIALKNEPVWTAISTFGLPYPPFDFNSGMWVRDISRSEAIDLGLMQPDDLPPEPDKRGFNDDLQADITDLAAPLQAALIDSISDIAQFVDGILKLKGA